MFTYHGTFAKANHYLDDADLPVVITLHGRFSQGWYFCFESPKNFLNLEMRPRVLAGNAPLLLIQAGNGKLISLGVMPRWYNPRIMGPKGYLSAALTNGLLPAKGALAIPRHAKLSIRARVGCQP